MEKNENVEIEKNEVLTMLRDFGRNDNIDNLQNTFDCRFFVFVSLRNMLHWQVPDVCVDEFRW